MVETLQAKQFLSTDEAGELLGLSRRTIYRLISRGELEVHKVGGKNIILRSTIDNLFTK